MHAITHWFTVIAREKGTDLFFIVSSAVLDRRHSTRLPLFFSIASILSQRKAKGRANMTLPEDYRW